MKIVWLSISGVTELAVLDVFVSLACGFCVSTVDLVVSLGLVFVLSFGSVVSMSWKLALSISLSSKYGSSRSPSRGSMGLAFGSKYGFIRLA